MPIKIKNLCLYPRCSELAHEDAYCIKHSKDAKRTGDKRRGTASARGYDHTWNKFRLYYMKRHPLCVDCFINNIVEPAQDIHHILKLKDGGKRLDEANCMSLCHRCHSIRTAKGE